MAVTFASIHEELAAVLNDLKERPGADEQPWCPARDAEAICRQIVDRTQDLGTQFGAIVRFARVASFASPRSYVGFVFQPSLRAFAFRSAIQRARIAGLLDPEKIEVAETGVRLLEPAMRLEGLAQPRPFDITFAQMPRIAALLDVLHNSLGYAVVSEMLSPVLARDTPASVADVARSLRNLFSQWLQPRLESAHRRAQAKTIHAFLASKHALLPEKIGDAIIFDFWHDRALTWHRQLAEAGEPAQGRQIATVEKAASDEGFRLFKSTARTVLRYRAALEDAAGAASERRSLRFGHDSEDGGYDLEVHAADSAGATAEWSNPLADLLVAASGRIKWLNDREVAHLTNYLGSGNLKAPAGNPEASDSEAEAAGELMERRPFDSSLLRTLLRADVFGEAQARIVARLRKRQAPAQAMLEIVDGLDAQAFQRTVQAYRDVHQQIDTEAHAALRILAVKGRPSALLLIDHLGGGDAKQAALKSAAPASKLTQLDSGGQWAVLGGGTGTDTELERLGSGIARLMATDTALPEPLVPLFAKAHSCRRKVAREGFRPQDEDSNVIIDRMDESVPPLIALHRDLERLSQNLTAWSRTSDPQSDLTMFAETFRLIYAAPARG
jgi:hypothetical protein